MKSLLKDYFLLQCHTLTYCPPSNGSVVSPSPLCCCLVARSRPTLCNTMDCSALGFPVLLYLPVCSKSSPLNQWWHPTISCSVIPFSSHLQSFPAAGSFQMNQLFTSGGHGIGVSALASVLSVNIQDWFPLQWTDWISLQSKGLLRVFSNSTVQKHQVFRTQLSL